MPRTRNVEVRRPYASPIKLVFWIAVLGLVFAGMASASRRPSLMEEYAMVVGNVSTGGRSWVWALVSTRNPHYGVVFAKPCHAAPCTSYTRPAHAWLLRRATLDWTNSLVAQAQLRPPIRREIVRMCRIAPKPVRRDLLAAVCKN